MKRALVVAVLLVAAARAAANELAAEPRTLRMNDLVTIAVSLEGPFASVEGLNIPLQNLALVGEPSVTSEFVFVNGELLQRKFFRQQAHPLVPGAAIVGPLTVDSPDGQRLTLPPVALLVQPDRASGSNDPEVVLRELLATRRDPLFVVAEVDKTSVYAGEPVVVAWYLYNAATVQQWHVVAVPKLEDFWTEDIPVRSEAAERAFVGSALMQRVPVRKVVLYPLRDGSLRVGGMTVKASVMRRIRTGPFAMFEGELIETTFTSAPVDIAVKPLPEGPPPDAVGELALTCQGPWQRNNGPVVLEATLAGSGNLRAAKTPRFAGPVDGDVRTENWEVHVTREDANVTMRRSWQYLIFPSRSGTMRLPELTMRVFVPSAGEHRELRCNATTLDVTYAAPPKGTPEARTPPGLPSRNWRPWLLGALALLLVALLVPRARRALRLRREVRAIVAGKSPADIRAGIDARLNVDPAKLIVERSDRGEAYRALRSLLDAMERERDLPVTGRELARRVRDVLTIAR